ncbi:hypothetical protein D8Y20_08600 [Mariprofundus sp. EBB-1]|uniref:hypothetical protein n=1 Tax=Mariprofundus sp. EBB-1 TaxID=2650971 RepID=UPI000EF1C9C4|nr:hypothetical protein [Mariprofundus sp. EBB-1]RLL51737.1 hypothetical protein D8Y20_08600 [Mariprofundus sp. EBB-1]
MFEKVVLRRSDNGLPLSVGEIAEALLFYQNVHLILDHSTLAILVRQIGMPHFLRLLSKPNVSAVYCEESLATSTENISNKYYHKFVAMTLAGNQEAGALKSRKKRIEFILNREGYNRRQSKRLAESFCRRVPLKKLSDDYFIAGGVINAVNSDIVDSNFVHEAMRRAVAGLSGKVIVPADFQFEIISSQPTFQIITNFDFDALNVDLKAKDPSHEDLTPAHLANVILEASTDTVLAAHYGGEFYTSNTSSDLIQLRHKGLLKRIGIEKNELGEFNEIVINDAPSVREALNSGVKSFDEFLVILDKSQKFRDWVQGVNPDEKIVREYMNSINSEAWINRTDSKILRYILGSGVTYVEPVIGGALSVLDSLFSDKIFQGWRPSHFVDNRLKPFLGEK